MTEIAVLGAGPVGVSIGKALTKAGYKIVYGSRDPQSEKVKKVLEEVSGSVADSLSNASKRSQIVFLATPWNGTEDAIKAAGDLTGKVVVDMTNPIGEKLSYPLKEGSGGELVAKWATGAKVVKAFNALGCNIYEDPQFGAQKADLYICGDAEGKVAVSKIAQEIGFDPVDCGDISVSYKTEHLALFWIHLAYGAKLGRDFTFKIIKH